MHSKEKFDDNYFSFFPGCQVMHAINEETVWALGYCGLTLTLVLIQDLMMMLRCFTMAED